MNAIDPIGINGFGHVECPARGTERFTNHAAQLEIEQTTMIGPQADRGKRVSERLEIRRTDFD
jgi:hypothetical protein